jgi:GAF domain-containing protein
MIDNIIDIEKKIEKATSLLFRQEERLTKIIQECHRLGFTVASIQLIRPEEQIIEAVTGEAWAGKARHYLEPNPDLRDIQADICQTCKTEIIAGWDKKGRFDKWVYKENNHQNMVRIFTPLILIQNHEGANDQEWFDKFEGKWTTPRDVNEDWFNQGKEHEPNGNGQQDVVGIFLPVSKLESYKGHEVKVIGTIEVGYNNPRKPIELDEVNKLIAKAGRWALEIRKTQLPSVLESIAKVAMQAVEADATNLHFLEGLPAKSSVLEIGSHGNIQEKLLEVNLDSIPYTYTVFCGHIGRDFIRECTSRKNGRGLEAIRDNKIIIVPDFSQGQQIKDLEIYNPNAFRQGIKTIVIVPLIVQEYTSEDKYQGCLYIHFKQEKHFKFKQEKHFKYPDPFKKDQLIDWLKLFGNRLEQAIHYAMVYEHQRDSRTQFIVLHSVAQSLTNSLAKEDLLEHIAWSTLNVLAADTITIYRYIQASDFFLSSPARAGRLKGDHQDEENISSKDVPYKLVRRAKNVYSTDEDYQEVFGESNFTQNEGIQATAGILLKVNEQIVGTLLVNYRRPHKFTADEKGILETLAASAAITITNQQWLNDRQKWLENRQKWLTALSDINRYIKTTLSLKILPEDDRRLLTLIMQKSQECTGADLADIRIFDQEKQELEMKVWHPASDPNPSSIHTKLGEGITGWVAENRRTANVPDVQTDNRYKSIYEKKSRSELCVPLIDQKLLFGVINLESYRKAAFDERDEQMLEALADQVVIAIQTFTNKEQLIKTKALIEFANVTNSLILKINSEMDEIRKLAGELYDLNSPDSEEREKAWKIFVSSARIAQKAQGMQVWIQEEDKVLINVCSIIDDILLQIGSLPPEIIKENQLPDDLPNVYAGIKQLTAVFEVLIRNALNAMPEGGVLSLGGQRINGVGINGQKETSVEVWVKDTGKGILAEHLRRVFSIEYSSIVQEEFGNPSTSEKKGIGIGLSIAQTYVQSLGGFISV